MAKQSMVSATFAGAFSNGLFFGLAFYCFLFSFISGIFGAFLVTPIPLIRLVVTSKVVAKA